MPLKKTDTGIIYTHISLLVGVINLFYLKHFLIFFLHSFNWTTHSSHCGYSHTIAIIAFIWFAISISFCSIISSTSIESSSNTILSKSLTPWTPNNSGEYFMCFSIIAIQILILFSFTDYPNLLQLLISGLILFHNFHFV